MRQASMESGADSGTQGEGSGEVKKSVQKDG